jgi:hypothetical protein
MKTKDDNTFYGRRKFLASVTRLAGTSIVMAVPGIGFAGALEAASTFTVKQVIDIILKEVADAPFATRLIN